MIVWTGRGSKEQLLPRLRKRMTIRRLEKETIITSYPYDFFLTAG